MIFVSDRALKLKIRHIIVLATAEHDIAMSKTTRIADPSYELMDDHNGLSIIYREHGFPCPLVRWHFHKEYELHLIVASSGKVFVGDYIGNFNPASLFLTGPNLPHNWISQIDEGEVVAKRDMLVNFTDELLESGNQVFAELKTLTPLLERARYGIEFRCKRTIRQAMKLMQKIADSEAYMAIFPPPPVQGLGTIGGFRLQIEDRGNLGYDELYKETQNIIAKSRSVPELAGLFTSYTVNVPQVDAAIDREKAKTHGVAVSDIFDTLQVYLDRKSVV